MKVAGFSTDAEAFELAASYRDWKFIHSSSPPQPVAATAAAAAQTDSDGEQPTGTRLAKPPAPKPPVFVPAQRKAPLPPEFCRQMSRIDSMACASALKFRGEEKAARCTEAADARYRACTNGDPVLPLTY